MAVYVVHSKYAAISQLGHIVQDNRNAIADSSTLRLILIYDLKKQKPAEIF